MSNVVARVRAIAWPVCALAFVVLAGCTVGAPPAAPPVRAEPSSTSPPSSDPTPSAAPTSDLEPAATPVVGECRYIPDGGFGRFSDLSRLTACDDEHTAETIWVGEVTGAEAAKSAPDWETVLMETSCVGHLTEYLGSGDWMATRLAATAFVAPIDQWRLGARWVRCDVYLPELGADAYRHGDALHAPVVLTTEMITTLQGCYVYDPDEPHLAVTIDCAEPHNRETIAPTLDLSSLGEEFPGEESMTSSADEHCLGAITDFLGGDPQELSFAWAGPTEEMWDQGDRVVLCYVEVIGGRMAGTARGAGAEIQVIPFAPGEDDPTIDPYADGAGT